MEQTTPRPFEQLSIEDQKAAIDVAVALTILGTRIPTLQKTLTDFIVTEFTSCYGLPRNIVKYAFRELGTNLFRQDWGLTVTKSGNKLTTRFTPLETSGGGNGEIIIQE